MKRVAGALVVGLIVTGCGGLASSAPASPAVSPAPSAHVHAPAEVELAGARWRIAARVWRNVQPHAGGGGVPRCANLCAKVTVERVSGDPDAEVTVTAVWALRPDGMAPFGEITVEPAGRGLEATAERGPRTDAGTTLAIVAQLEGDGTSILVRSPEVEVGPDA